MSNEARKERIRFNLRLTQYPRKATASFSSDADHNPLIWEDCPHCLGSGKYCSETDGAAELVTCPLCKGTGTTGEVVLYFENNASAMEASVDASGWLTCPGCRWRFSTKDKHVWTGLRHIRCGQRISVL